MERLKIGRCLRLTIVLKSVIMFIAHGNLVSLIDLEIKFYLEINA